MDNTQLLILFSIALPFFGSPINVLLNRFENLRDLATLIVAIITFILVVLILLEFKKGAILDFSLFTVVPGLEIGFHVEPLLSLIHI